MAESTPVPDRLRPHRKLARRYRKHLYDRQYLFSLTTSLVFFIISWFVNYYAIIFATDHASNSSTDIILSNIPVFNVDGLFVYGSFFFAVIAIGILLAHPKRLPFALYAVALFWIIRSIFTSVTHIAPFESHYASSFGPAINSVFFGGDTFFSGHTGMPFLGALAFWKEKPLRYLFLIATAFFGVIVLLGHLHYTIDVLSALFITYGIFRIALWLFPQDAKRFYADDVPL